MRLDDEIDAYWWVEGWSGDAKGSQGEGSVLTLGDFTLSMDGG